MSEESFHMVRTEMNRARLFELARVRRLPLRDIDFGYLIHCALRSVFGELAPQPFSFDDTGRSLTVLGYGLHPSETLLEHAQAFADPLAWSVCPRDGVRSKPMPTRFASGTRLGFSVRICPVVRRASTGPRQRKGAEVDVFLARCGEANSSTAIDRETVYRNWLIDRLTALGAVRDLSAKMSAFRLERVTRRTHLDSDAEKFRVCERPEVRFTGVLEVGDPERFGELLRRGVGRHRAFGFGMLLLRPPGSSAC